MAKAGKNLTINQKYSNCQKESAALKKAKDSLARSFDSLKVLNDSLTKTNNSLAVLNDSLILSNKSLKATKDSLINNNSSLRKTNKTKDDSLNSLTLNVYGINADSLSLQNNTLSKENQTLIDSIQKLDSSYKALDSLYKSSTKNLRSSKTGPCISTDLLLDGFTKNLQVQNDLLSETLTNRINDSLKNTMSTKCSQEQQVLQPILDFLTEPQGCCIAIALIISITLIALRRGVRITKGSTCISICDDENDKNEENKTNAKSEENKTKEKGKGKAKVKSEKN